MKSQAMMALSIVVFGLSATLVHASDISPDNSVDTAKNFTQAATENNNSPETPSALFALPPEATESGRSTCALNDLNESAEPLARVLAAAPRTGACLISHAGLTQPETYLVIDTRASEDYEKYRIAGSLNIPAYKIKTMAYLKARNLLLVAGNHGYAELEQACADLQQNGFSKVAVLRGGLNVWNRTIGPLEGTPDAGSALNEIEPRAFFEEHRQPDYLLFDRTRTPAQSAKLLPDAQLIALDASADDRKTVAQISAAIEAKKIPAEALTAIVINAEGRADSHIDTLISSAGITNVLFLAGGWTAYDSFAASQSALLAHLANPPRRTPKCNT